LPHSTNLSLTNWVFSKFDKLGFDELGFDELGFDELGFDKLGFNELGFDKLGFNELGFDKLGFDELGFDKLGFDELRLNLFFGAKIKIMFYCKNSSGVFEPKMNCCFDRLFKRSCESFFQMD
jgi:hypothetical protein